MARFEWHLVSVVERQSRRTAFSLRKMPAILLALPQGPESQLLECSPMVCSFLRPVELKASIKVVTQLDNTEASFLCAPMPLQSPSNSKTFASIPAYPSMSWTLLACMQTCAAHAVHDCNRASHAYIRKW